MLAYLSIQTPEPPGRVPGPEGQSPDSETSDFIASGGLVPDSAPPVAAEDDEANHAAVTAPASAGATAFLLAFIHGKATEPFDMDRRSFFLRFNTEDPAGREAAFRDMCQELGIDAAPA